MFVLVLRVSQAEPRGMLCAPVGWGVPEAPSPPPRLHVNYSHDGKMDSGCKLLLLAFAIEMKSFCFLMKSHMFPVNLGTSLLTSDFCPGNRSPFFIPDSSAEGRGQDLKTKLSMQR